MAIATLLLSLLRSTQLNLPSASRKDGDEVDDWAHMMQVSGFSGFRDLVRASGGSQVVTLNPKP